MARYRATIVFNENEDEKEMVLFGRPDTMNAFALGAGMLLPGTSIKMEQMTKEGIYGPYEKQK